MATAVVVGGAIVNALAFSGSNYLFSKLGGSDEERRRHDIALEELSKAEQEYEHERIQRLDFINEKLKEQKHAVQTFSDIDQAMQEYYLVTGEDLSSTQGIDLKKKPKLANFYQPSDNQKAKEVVFILFSMVAVYGVAVFIQKKHGRKKWLKFITHREDISKVYLP